MLRNATFLHFSRARSRAMSVAVIYYLIDHYVYSSAGFVGLDSSLLAMLICFNGPRFKT